MYKKLGVTFCVAACCCFAIGIFTRDYAAMTGGGLFAIACALCYLGPDHIKKAPATDVVRCRECRYFREDAIEPCVFTYGMPVPGPNDFCSCGERRGDRG